MTGTTGKKSSDPVSVVLYSGPARPQQTRGPTFDAKGLGHTVSVTCDIQSARVLFQESKNTVEWYEVKDHRRTRRYLRCTVQHAFPIHTVTVTLHVS